MTHSSIIKASLGTFLLPAFHKSTTFFQPSWGKSLKNAKHFDRQKILFLHQQGDSQRAVKQKHWVGDLVKSNLITNRKVKLNFSPASTIVNKKKQLGGF